MPLPKPNPAVLRNQAALARIAANDIPASDYRDKMLSHADRLDRKADAIAKAEGR